MRGNLFYLHILPGRHEGPGPHVPLLLLGPDEGLGVAVGLQHLLDLSGREGAEAL